MPHQTISDLHNLLMEEIHLQGCICHKILSLIKLSLEITVKTQSLRDDQVERPRGLHFIGTYRMNSPSAIIHSNMGGGGEECWGVGDENSFPAFLGILESAFEVIDTCLSTLPFTFYNLMFTFRATETRIRLDNINKHFIPIFWCNSFKFFWSLIY